ncbi:neutral zinc metallopeptidase [Actinopolyspora mortivallis]|uniref:Metalloprotease n=1 Tax=Actinopolyspora mortivallis TaxID=33906 RepID=A0A2T0GTK9_ACTMO|nr:neutral zinc metallopeptidase [Actinopolyspora mortivallis]PRW62458.1 hypothetical protein CEP50_15455 [Actinopolyspora mortivallis]
MFRSRRRRKTPSFPEDDPGEQRNSPWAILGVLGLVFGVVLVTALAKPEGLFPDEPPERSSTAAPRARDGAPQRIEPAGKLEHNPVTDRSLRLAEVECELPELTETRERMLDYYRRAVECLDRAWSDVLTGAGVQRRTPRVSLDSQAPDCRERSEERGRPTAFYCSGTIHLPRQWVLADLGTREESHLMLLAHEYGHHVQHLSEIMRASAVRRGGAPGDDPKTLRLVRRLELQAECFAGMFMARLAETPAGDAAVVERLVTAPGSTKMTNTHGSPDNQRRWREAGYRRGNTGACDTWSAPESAVR